ncbi:tetratricopeptide repeat domain-containing protein [Chloropicon primus]|uniref:Tetratricopeptide repeat domain-containing protein n=1 Tax=Chloropicon primus TaxID=1764295 RepID=A0A5B8MJU1_9CHLO|nr:tetratricopeptide repeat domain-containing protein [Chloropicon primus]UPQ99948.1 tetratricopeptide repeat domain-containing protein [Chloropicon primus]|eukprot:QDZ20736.1 tetratricopeptide repeat domain-containing protein [Chloropicon primus]
MKVEHRGPASLEEKKEFDQVTFDQIQEIDDVQKLRRLEQYMRDEGFPSTADAARVRLHEMGSRTFADDEELARREAEEELNRAREELTSWKAELGALKTSKQGKTSHQEVPAVRDGVTQGSSNNIKEVVEESLDASEVEWMAEREKEKGNELFKSGEYKECVEAYDKSIDLLPKAATLANRAAAKLKLKLYDSAIEDCTQALEQDPKYVKVLMRRAVARMELMQYEEAYDDIQAALGLAPGNKELEKMRDRVLRKMPQTVTKVQIEEVSDSEDSEEAEAEEIDEDEIGKIVEITDEEPKEEDIGKIEEIVDEPPAVKEVQRSEPAAAKTQSRTKIEIEICSDSSEDESSDGEEEAGVVGQDGGRGESPSAQGPAAESPSVDENALANELKVKGNKAYASGDLNAALHWYTESIKRKECSLVYSNRAQVHLKLGHQNSAISDCTKALRLDSKNIKATYRRAVAFKEAGRIKEALSDYEKVKGKLPNRDDIVKQIHILRQKIEGDLSIEDSKGGAKPTHPKPAKASPAKSPAKSIQEALERTLEQQQKQQLPVPNSSTEFETNVRFIRKNPAELAKYIYQIPPEKFAVLFKNAFTSEILGSTIEGLLAGFDQGGEAFTFCHTVLASFTQADRFSITSKMLSSKQKVCLGELFTRLSEASPSAGGEDIDLASLKKGYGVK